MSQILRNMRQKIVIFSDTNKKPTKMIANLAKIDKTKQKKANKTKFKVNNAK